MDEMLATIVYFAGDFVPQGWMSCNGATLQVQQNAALFSLLGNRFGGWADGKFEGQGSFLHADGSGYTGAFMHGEFSGFCWATL